MRAFWIVLFVLWSSLTEASLVRVSSVYPDQTDSSRKIRVGGSGLLFAHEANGRMFVFTASHVSQGENLAVDFAGRSLTVIGRQMHDSQDLELIEVSGVTPPEVAAKFSRGHIFYDTTQISRRRVIDGYNFVPLLPWVTDPNLDVDNAYNSARASALYLDALSGLLNGDYLIQPGTSGSPLVTIVPAPGALPHLPYDMREGLSSLTPGQAVVRGIAIRRERFFSRGGIVYSGWMRELLKNYLNSTPSQSEVKWKARGGILYRELDRFIETASTSGATAGGVLVDAGNGVYIDGGDLGSLGEETPAEFLGKISAFPLHDGQPMSLIVFMSRHPNPPHELINFLAWFDMEVYARVRRFMMALGDDPSNPRDMVGDFNQRLNKTTPFEIAQPQYIGVDANGLTGRIIDDGDTVEFRINRLGAHCVDGVCAARFQPMIEVVSARGLPYILDLKELFYVDLGGTPIPALSAPGADSLSPEAVNTAIFDMLSKLYVKPRLHYRRKRTSVEPMTVAQGQRKTVEWTR